MLTGIQSDCRASHAAPYYLCINKRQMRDPLAELYRALDVTLASNSARRPQEVRQLLETVVQEHAANCVTSKELFAIESRRAVLERVLSIAILRDEDAKSLATIYEERCDLEFNDPIDEWLNSAAYLSKLKSLGASSEATRLAGEIRQRIEEMRNGCDEALEQIERMVVGPSE